MPAPPSRARRALRLAVLVPLARLRFLVVLGAIGLVILKWDDLAARWEKHVHTPDPAAAADPDHEFFCPMHPTVVRATAKEKCPICAMPLSKRKKGEATADALPAGSVSRVQLTPYRVVLAGVRTAPVAFHSLTRDLTTAGTVEFDERNVRVVAARVKGRVDRLFVNQTGQMVHRDDPLAELYSPDLVVTAQNLVDARAAGNKVLETTARDRLRLWGIDDKQIAEIAAAGKPITRLTIRSPITGHVLKKAVREGQYVDEGGPLFDVADLSTVWVQAQLYEDDLSFLPAGGHDPATGRPTFDLKAVAVTRAFPDRAFAGTLSFLFPHVDPDTRTLTARFELPNPGHELRPGMTATVTLKLTPDLLAKTPAGVGVQARDGTVLAVPESAVIDTGAQKVVYREALPNTFEGILVTLGPRLTGPDRAAFYPVLGGLAEGDKVVVAGAFLLDAETRLNPALGSVYVGGSGGAKPAAAVRPTTPEDRDTKAAAGLALLPPAERKAAVEQVWCPVFRDRLGVMGKPVRVALPDGRSVFVCCAACTAEAVQTDPAELFRRVGEMKQARPAAPSPAAPSVELDPERAEKVRAGLAKLSAEDRRRAVAQRLCPVQGKPLGLMGRPVELRLPDGRTVFLCCESGCKDQALADPAGVLKKAEESRKLPAVLPEDRP
jgi:Cu(I)/Ag(I) efflux system membrane fusion protein